MGMKCKVLIKDYKTTEARSKQQFSQLRKIRWSHTPMVLIMLSDLQNEAKGGMTHSALLHI